jgi:hypothetical protein
VLHLLPHGISIFKVISEIPAILTSKYLGHGKGAVTFFNVLGLMRSARAGLGLTASRSNKRKHYYQATAVGLMTEWDIKLFHIFLNIGKIEKYRITLFFFIYTFLKGFNARG